MKRAFTNARLVCPTRGVLAGTLITEGDRIVSVAQTGQSSTPSAVTSCMRLRSPPKVAVPGATSLARIQSQPLRSSLRRACSTTDRKSVVSGKSVSVRVDLGGRRIIKKKKQTHTNTHNHIIKIPTTTAKNNQQIP